jgi:phage tail sheath protein FI
MATYNKPGVYIEESLTPNVPTPAVISQSVAAFVGFADRGPTKSINNNVVGSPTLVTNWSEFVNTFSYGSNINTFSGIPAVTLSGASSSSTTITLSGSTTERLKVGSVITVISGTGTLQENTVVISVTSATEFVIDKAPSVALNGAALSATTNSDLKYAVKSFFDNGGSQAYILRDVNSDAVKASANIRDRNSIVNLSGEITFDASTANHTDKKLTITQTSGTPFLGFSAGRVVSISNVPAGDYDFLNGNDWVVEAVSGNNRSLTLVAYPDTAIATSTVTVTVSTTVSPVSIVGGGLSNVNSLRVSAKSAGAWGNGVWVGIYPNASENFFDLHVYYDVTATSAISISDTDRVERFTNLNMDPASDRYAISAVNSSWIELTDLGSTAPGARRLPSFTGAWGGEGSYNVDTENKLAFTWNISSFTPYAGNVVRLGVSSNTPVAATVNFGTDGATHRSAEDVVAQFDAVTVPLLINWAGNSKTEDVNACLSYAAERGDSFIIIDAANVSVSTVLGTGTDTGIGSYATNTNYGAAYYPYIVIADPASTTGKTKSIAPGGAVAAIYGSTDSSRGVFKAPAGATSIVRTAVSVPSLSNAEFNLVGNNSSNLNVIRFVPGSGICVMGARTLSNQYSDKYVPVRRTLNYLGANLKNITAFAVFEPNDQNLWAQVTGVVSGFLNDFWRRGGLAGATPAQAFYVKCDSSINPSNSVNAGELHIEVGVALQKPAEFVIIRIGQLDGGATVTTSV